MNEQPPRAARRRLIDELQALHETLQGNPLPPATPPLPETVLSPTSAPPLLDLGTIFEEGLFNNDDGDAPLLFWPMQELSVTPAAAPATDRIALIEQIVARLLPDLEQQLRDQLRGLDVESLRRLLR